MDQNAGNLFNICLKANSRKGFKYSPESCNKIRLANLGKKLSAETRRKMSESKKQHRS